MASLTLARGGTRAARHLHFVHLIKKPNLHPSVREAFTREVEFRSVESGKAYSHNKRKSQTYLHENDGNWIHLAEDRDFWKKEIVEIVEKVKFHYNYRYPEPIAEAATGVGLLG